MSKGGQAAERRVCLWRPEGRHCLLVGGGKEGCVHKEVREGEKRGKNNRVGKHSREFVHVLFTDEIQ